MNRCLSEIGFRAVCVDGFIPPRAFQAFQSLGILPIAAEIRSPDHLPYTPAPDIIHEAAGHAPILVDPGYSHFIRSIGEVSSRAFSSPADARVDRAVRALSDLKDTHNSDPEAVRLAEEELVQAVASLGVPSEATRMARLYWWTAEYGLVGRVDDYRLYGAGLLSSLGESHFCHRKEVKKLPLGPACTLVGYDITRPQPQLFVARDFEHLGEVLADVERTLAHKIGGPAALEAARRSEEVCTVELEGGFEILGHLLDVQGPEGGELLHFARGAGLVAGGEFLGRAPDDLWVGIGPTAKPQTGADHRVRLPFRSGAEASGVMTSQSHWPTLTGLVPLSDFRLEWRGATLQHCLGPSPLLVSPGIVTARAGSSAAEYSPLGVAADTPGRARERPRVPKLRKLSSKMKRLERLYARVAHPEGDRAVTFANIYAEAARNYPHEWLLRWNLLERLGGGDSTLARVLHAELLELETHYDGRHPIVMGLDYLARNTESSS
jgi:phenylalanine-4-hydroxylase